MKTALLSCGLTVAFVFALAAGPAAPLKTADQIINFEGFPSGTLLTTQYAPAGVAEFGNGPSKVACVPVGVYSPGSYASSPPNAAYANGSGEFPSGRLCMRFASLASRVTVQAGTNVVNAGSQTVSLIGYDAAGIAISGTGTATKVVPANGFAGAAHRLAIQTASPKIRWAVVQLASPGGIPAGGQLPGIDDLSFDTPTPAPTTFTLAAAHSSPVIRASSTVTIPLTVLRFGQPISSGDIQFSTSALPKGVTATFAPNPLSGGAPAQQVTLTLHAAPDAPATTAFSPFTISATPASPAVGPSSRMVGASVAVVPALRLTVAERMTDTPSPNTGPPAHVEVYPCQTTTVPISLRVPKSDSPPPTDPVALIASKPNEMKWVTASFSKTKVMPVLEPLPAATVTLTLKTGAYTPTDGSPIFMNIQATQQPGIQRDIDLKFERKGSGEITSLSGSSVIPPELLKPGSPIEIHGRGFCPGSTVQFGNRFAIVSPTSIDLKSSPQVIKARAPRLATTGDLTVLNASGASLPSLPKSIYVSSQRNTFGFSFSNYGKARMGWDVAVALYGEDQTMLHAGDPCGLLTLGAVDCGPQLIPDPVVYSTWKAFMEDKGENGLCFGWDLAAQRLSRVEADFGAFPPYHPVGAHQWDLDGPGGPSDPLDFYIQQQFAAQFSAEATDHRLSGDGTFTTLAELRSVYRNELVKARAANRGLPLIELRFNGHGHIVAVTDAVDVPNGVLNLFVMDPNVPFRPWEDKNAVAHSSRELNSKFIFKPNGDWVFLNPFNGVTWYGSIDSLRYWDATEIPPTPTFPNGPQGQFVILSSRADVDQVTDAVGHRLFKPNGKPETDPRARLPGAVIAPTLDGSSRSSPATIMLRGLRRVNVHVKPRGQTPWRTGFVGHGTAGIVEVGNGTNAALTLDPNAAAIAVHPATAAPLRLRLALRAPDGTRRSATFSGRSTGGSDRLTFDAQRRNIQLLHQGPATTGSIEIGRAHV